MANPKVGQLLEQEGAAAKALGNPLGDVLYVDSTNGRDGNDGLSKRHPLLTLARALALATAGDTIVCAPGGSETVTVTIAVSLAGVQIVCPTANPQAGYTIQGAGTLDLLTVSAANVRVSGLRFAHTGATASAAGVLTTAAADKLRVEHCAFDDSAIVTTFTGAGVEITDAANDVVVEDCLFLDTQWGVLFRTATGVTVLRPRLKRNTHYVGKSAAFGVHTILTGTGAVRGIEIRESLFYEANGDGSAATAAWDGTDGTNATQGPISFGAAVDQYFVGDCQAYTAAAVAFDNLNAINAGAAGSTVGNVTGTGDDVSAIATAVDSVGTQTGSVGTQAGSVGTQVTSVGTQTGSVGTQVTSVGTLTTSVGTQTGSVGTQTGSVGTQVTSVGTLTASVGTQATSLGTQVGSVGTQTGSVGTLTASVGTQATSIGTQVGSVGTQTASVGTQVTSVGTLVDSVGTQAGSVGTQVGSVGTLTTSVGTQATSLGTQVGSVGTLTTSVGTQVTSVGTLTTSVGTQVTSVGTLTTSVGTQVGSVGTQTGSVGTQTGSVGTQVASVGTAQNYVGKPVGIQTIFADTALANNVQGAGGVIATATGGSVVIEEVVVVKDTVALTGPTNVEITADGGAYGPNGADDPIMVITAASLGVRDVRSSEEATTELVPCVLLTGGKLYIHGDDAAGTSGGNIMVLVFGRALSAGATLA